MALNHCGSFRTKKSPADQKDLQKILFGVYWSSGDQYCYLVGKLISWSYDYSRSYAMSTTYLTTEELAARIHYDARTIRNQLVDNCLIEGRHYIKPFGRRKFLFIWEAIENDMLTKQEDTIAMPLANWGEPKMGAIRARKETGLLFIDFRWEGKRCREQTNLRDNATNCKSACKTFQVSGVNSVQ
jgi:hypothetical protein